MGKRKWTSPPRLELQHGEKPIFKQRRESEGVQNFTASGNLIHKETIAAHANEKNAEIKEFRKPFPPTSSPLLKSWMLPTSLPNSGSLDPANQTKPNNVNPENQTIVNLKSNLLAELAYGPSTPDFSAFSKVVQQLSHAELPKSTNGFRNAPKDTPFVPNFPIRPEPIYAPGLKPTGSAETQSSSLSRPVSHAIPDLSTTSAFCTPPTTFEPYEEKLIDKMSTPEHSIIQETPQLFLNTIISPTTSTMSSNSSNIRDLLRVFEHKMLLPGSSEPIQCLTLY